MFEAIGFVPFFKTKDLIIYENFPDNEKERINVVFYLKKEILFDGLVMEIENHDGLLNKEVVEIETGVRASQNECYNILSVEGVIKIKLNTL